MDFLKRQDHVTLNTGDTAYVLVNTAMIMFMIPGIGLFYSGLAPNRNALFLIMVGLLSLCLVSMQWIVLGYSLSFSTSSNPIIGNLKNFLFLNVGSSLSELAPGIPTLAFAMFQGTFAAITPAIAVGSFCHKIRILPLSLFIILWTTFAYDPIAYWNWSKSGWIIKLGGLDYAGGTIVHVSSGFTSLAFTLYLKLKEPYNQRPHKPQNTLNVFLGTLIVWFGWYGFNAGNAISANARAALALINTNTSACAGALTFALLKYRANGNKSSVTDVCIGAFTGLIAITPACGYVEIWASPIIGALAAAASYYSLGIKEVFKINDDFDVLATHGVCGIVGSILTGVFTSKDVAAYSGAIIKGGWINHNWMQVPIQILAITVCALWTMAWTLIIILFMEYVIRIELIKGTEEIEAGADNTELCEGLYGFLKSFHHSSKTEEREKLVPLTLRSSERESESPTVRQSISQPNNLSTYPSTATGVDQSVIDMSELEKN